MSLNSVSLNCVTLSNTTTCSKSTSANATAPNSLALLLSIFNVTDFSNLSSVYSSFLIIKPSVSSTVLVPPGNVPNSISLPSLPLYSIICPMNSEVVSPKVESTPNTAASVACASLLYSVSIPLTLRYS